MEYIKFGKFIDFVQYGYTAERTYSEGDAQYLRITDIVPYFVNKETVPYVKIDSKKKIKYLVKKDDLLIVRTGATTGYNLLVRDGFDNFIFASYLVRYFYNKKKLYPVYLKHVLKSKQWCGFINNYIGGSAQPGMNPKTIGRFNVPYHSFEIQKKIATILDNYDQLIENNNKHVKLLERMAESLYEEWFVRFRNPLQVRNEFGRVGNICTIKSGFAYKSSNWQQEGISVVKIKDIVDGYVSIDELDAVPVEIAVKAMNFNLKEMDLVIAMTGATIGKVGIVFKNGLSTNQRVGKIFANKNYENITPFLFCFFRQQNIIETVLMYSGASSAQPNISGEMLQKINMPFNEKLIKLFNDKCKPLFEEIINLKNKNSILIKQRDSLLPRLMSGKLSVEGKEVI